MSPIGGMPMKLNKDVVQITSDLISRPSYVSDTDNEKAVVEYIKDFLKPLGGTVSEQKITKDRSNILVKFGSGPTKLFFGCHMDTVAPWQNGQFNPFEPVVKDDRLYGLGASDMKGGIGALLSALSQLECEKIDGLAILFDIDEEYDFLGMKYFVENCDLTFTKDALAIFPEAQLNICNAHRGLIEFEMTVEGKSAHAGKAIFGNKDQGVNAILGATRAIDELISNLGDFSHPDLGPTSCNLAWLEGGTANGNEIISRGNIVPNIARFKIDMRPAVAQLTAKKAMSLLQANLEKNGLKVVNEKINLDYGALYTDPKQIEKFIEIFEKNIGKAEYGQLGGYGEAEMMSRLFKVNSIYFGPGSNNMAHAKDEYCDLADLELAEKIYKICIEKYCL